MESQYSLDENVIVELTPIRRTREVAMKILQKDILIIGSGLSGIYTSLHVDENLSIAIVTKDRLVTSNSALAQGGIASCFNEEDSFKAHISDTLVAGSNMNKLDAVSLLVKEAPAEIYQLIEMGVEFDKDEEGMILTTLEGGHSHRRVLHANGDATGQVIMDTVISQVLCKKNIEILEKTMAIEIIKDDTEKVIGVMLMNEEEYIYVETEQVVIATGGVGALFKHTTNQDFSTGDGIALAHYIGCEIVDMCFIQFHPTAYYGESTDKRFLITEALRGEGAVLRNKHGQPFMHNYDHRGDLAPRDSVSKSIFEEMTREQSDHVWLDITHKDKETLEKRFPTIYKFLDERGIHMESDYIPVAPVAHYFVGGILADLNGETTVPGVYACGEVSSTGVHGANRLASNSLLECVVFGHRVANHINKKMIKKQDKNFLQQQPELLHRSNKTQIPQAALAKLAYYERKQEGLCHYDKQIECLKNEYKRDIQRVMSTYVGIVRHDEGLALAFKLIDVLQKKLCEDEFVCTMKYEINNMCIVAKEIIQDAISKPSIGCHFKREGAINMN